MPRVTAERLAATRRQILDGARRAFARHGYEGATVRVLEHETGLSRGAIFHHFRDKDALFLALAADDAEQTAATVAQGGLVEVMRGLSARDPGWLGVQLEVSRRLRTDPEFRTAWAERIDTVRRAAEERLRRGQASGQVRGDVPAETLTTFLTLVHDGLVLHLAAGESNADVDAVLRLTEDAVRRPTSGRSTPIPEDVHVSTRRQDDV